ncbi:MAG TPA: phasin family protein [Anaerolineales bacterium]
MAIRTKDTTGSKEYGPLFQGARKILLASIGVAALAQDEIEDFVNRMIERGEIAEQEGRELVREVMEKRKARRKESRDRFSERVEASLDHMNIPTKDDIDALSAKITALSKKIDDLKKSQS